MPILLLLRDWNGFCFSLDEETEGRVNESGSTHSYKSVLFMFILTQKFVLFIKANLLITPLVSKHKRKEEKIYIYKEYFGQSLLFFIDERLKLRER
jgi:hypothetical protein